MSEASSVFSTLTGVRFDHYRTILADPPWNFLTRSGKGRDRCPDGQGHYEVMSLKDIKRLGADVLQAAADDCVLLLWVTDPFLRHGLDVMQCWGFEYKTVGFYWAKTGKTCDWPMGNGYWTRANPEMCLLGTIGNPKRRNKDVRKLIVSPRREHSRKPDETIDRIERLIDGPYLELFSRTSRPGWDSWGDQAGTFHAEM